MSVHTRSRFFGLMGLAGESLQLALFGLFQLPGAYGEPFMELEHGDSLAGVVVFGHHHHSMDHFRQKRTPPFGVPGIDLH